ncbi:MAG: VOC family protein [Steroidobacteraceae bacterium]
MSGITTRPVLSGIAAVTYTVAQLDAVRDVYTRWLRYRIVTDAAVPAELAAAWGAPGVAGHRMLTLAPESGEPVLLRFIEHPNANGWRALRTHGWNVSEILVADVDGFAASLSESPLRIIGPPTPLQRFPMIRAMQVLGPCGECLYFTEVGEGSGLPLPRAESFVGRVFIVVAGAPDLAQLFATYEAFDNAVDPPVATRVRVISLMNDLPPETEHRHGLVKLADGTLIELDEYPAGTQPRAAVAGGLQTGMAVVTFTALGLENETPRVLRGAAGELIELVEAAR